MLTLRRSVVGVVAVLLVSGVAWAQILTPTQISALRVRANAGDAQAQAILGQAYLHGRGVARDDAQAVSWFRKAAGQEYATAQFNLGYLYVVGRGVPQDYAQAASWIRKAADQGLASAQFNLGIAYGNGEGVPRDYAQAAAWYRKAAEQGLASAQVNLGVMYGQGLGVPQDDTLAVSWFRTVGFAEARDEVATAMTPGQIADAQQRANAWLEELEKRMTPAQITDAQQRANAWLEELEKRGTSPVPSGTPAPDTGAVRPAEPAPAPTLDRAPVGSRGTSPVPSGTPSPDTGAVRPAEPAPALDRSPAGALRRIGATSLPVATQPLAAAPDLSALYDQVNSSIVKVETDTGHGSGFLVSSEGLIATNHHVVRVSRYVRIQFADGSRYEADVVALDPMFDLALLLVNAAVVSGRAPLALHGQGDDRLIRPGVPVVAFGSPLNQTFLMTQGIVSKVEDGVLFGDFLIEPGNSGGPLVTLDGRVVGINTFGLSSISGAVRVEPLRKLMDSDAVRLRDAPAPSPVPLPTLDARRYPTELLRVKILEEEAKLKDYQVDGGKFTITAYTPVMLGRLQVRNDMLQMENRLKRRGKNVDDPAWREVDGPFYDWMRSASDLLDYSVTFRVEPDSGLTTGSLWATGLSAFSAGYSGTPYVPPHQNVEFKAEFDDLRIYRDGVLLEPIRPGRSLAEAAIQDSRMTFFDEAYAGMYVYAPEDFMEGSNFRIEVYDARKKDKVHKTINLGSERSKLIQRIRSDFTGVVPPQQSPAGPGVKP